MQTTFTNGADIPTALPGIESDENRESLLLENHGDDIGDEVDPEELAAESPSKRTGARAGKILKSVVCLRRLSSPYGSSHNLVFRNGVVCGSKTAGCKPCRPKRSQRRTDDRG